MPPEVLAPRGAGRGGRVTPLEVGSSMPFASPFEKLKGGDPENPRTPVSEIPLLGQATLILPGRLMSSSFSCAVGACCNLDTRGPDRRQRTGPQRCVSFLQQHDHTPTRAGPLRCLRRRFFCPPQTSMLLARQSDNGEWQKVEFGRQGGTPYPVWSSTPYDLRDFGLGIAM